MEKAAGIERKEYGPHLYTERNFWYARLDKSSPGVPIPKDIARVIRLALWTESRFHRKWRSSRGSYNKSRYTRNEINCHRAALAAVGLLRIDDTSELGSTNEPYNRPQFAPSDLHAFNSLSALTNHIHALVADGIALVQIKRNSPDNKVMHSFIVLGTDARGRVLCFEKVGYDFSFQICELQDIYSRSIYQGNEYAVIPYPLVPEVVQQ